MKTTIYIERRIMMNQLITIMQTAFSNNTFISATLSNPRKAADPKKVTIKPLLLGEELKLQFTTYKDNKAYHENLNLEESINTLTGYGNMFKQIQLFTADADYQALINKKCEANIKRKAPSQMMPASLSHNRQKNYILDTKDSIPFLQALGLMDENEKVKPSKYDKYKQINRYLEIIADSMTGLTANPIRIIDFGCGKSYLTFALYHYLTVILGKEVQVVGLDLKADVIAFCQDLADKLGYTNLKFQVGDIGKYTTNQPVDMVVSLHACNTATDAALDKAIGWGAKVILAVPCCHHEAYTQIANEDLAPIFKHGILKERIAALMTDGLRAQMLEACGYKVNVIEFIDMAHTPKNILIKAILKDRPSFSKEAYAKYRETSDALNLSLSLEKMLQSQKAELQAFENVDKEMK